MTTTLDSDCRETPWLSVWEVLSGRQNLSGSPAAPKGSEQKPVALTEPAVPGKALFKCSSAWPPEGRALSFADESYYWFLNLTGN